MTDENGPELPGEIIRLADMMRDLGYKAQPLTDHSIQTAMSGYMVVLFYFDGHSIQMYAGFTPQDDFGLQQANAFNNEYRFTKCYVVPSGIRFEADFLFDLNDEHARDDLQLIFRSWEVSLGFISEALGAAQEGSGNAEEEIGADRSEEEAVDGS